MTATWKFYGALFTGAFLGLLASCQTYDFQPVEPAAYQHSNIPKALYGQSSKPNLMLMVDKSGSMQLPINAADPACPANCGVDWTNPGSVCPPACATRLSSLKLAMGAPDGGFLTNPASAVVGHLGIAAFPASQSLSDTNDCRPGVLVKDIVTTTADDNLDQLQQEANQINQVIQNLGTPSGLVVGGGTPTAASFSMLASTQSLLTDKTRASYVILMTDGVPNCDNGLDGSTCTCTVGNNCTGSSLACLDQQATTAAIKALANNNINTFVVGFGFKNQSNGAANATDVLNAMAEAGGEPRSCTKGNLCGNGDICDPVTSLCQNRFYEAENAADLSNVLAAIGKITGVDLCHQILNPAPQNPDYLQVTVDGVVTASGPDTWQYDPTTQKVTLEPTLCNRIGNASAGHPVQVDYEYVQPL